MKSLIIIIIYLIAFQISSHSEITSSALVHDNGEREIDSLIKELNLQTNDEKVKLYSAIIKKLRSVDPEKALLYANKGLSYANSIQYKEGIVLLLNNRGSLCKVKGDYPDALKDYHRALEMSINIDSKKDIAKCCNNLAVLYRKLKQYDKAYDYIVKALQLKIELKDTRGTAAALMNMGLILKSQKKYDKALDYYNQSLEIAEKNKIDGLRNKIFNNLGVLFLKLKDETKAGEYFKKALKLKKESNDKETLIVAYNNIAKVLIEEDEFNNALSYIDTAYTYALELNNLPQQSLSLKRYSDVYAGLGNFEKAYEYSVMYNKVRFDIYNNEIKEDLIDKQVETVSKSKDEKIVELSVYNEQLSKNKIYMIIILSISLIIATYFIIRSAVRQRINRKLQQINRELNQLNEQLKESEKNLKELNYTKDKFFSIIAHDLRNPLGAFISLSETLVKDFDKQNKDEVKELTEGLYKSSKSLYALLENLLDWSRIQTNRIKFNPVNVDLWYVLNSSLAAVSLNAEQKNIIIKNNIPRDTYVYADVNMVITILRNLLVNAVKYTHEGGKIHIYVTDKCDLIEVSVEDSGVGISHDDIENLFNLERINSKKGTLNEKGSGLGLILCKEFVEKNSGKISVSSFVGKGSTFKFTLLKQVVDEVPESILLK